MAKPPITPPAVPVKSVDWYKESVSRLRNITARDLMNDPSIGVKNVNALGQAYIGKMVLFFYDPKHKDTLPYYDRYPLIFPIEWYRDGSMLGINMHYLRPDARRKLLAEMSKSLLINKDKPEQAKLLVSYSILKSAARYKAFTPCIKKYLLSHVRSRFSIIPLEQWDNVVSLPLQRFEKATSHVVYNDSFRQIRKNKGKL